MKPLTPHYLNAILHIAAVAPRTKSEGPGKRFAIWVQGCSIHCPGCCNPEMLPFSGGKQIPVQKILEDILNSPCEGVSLLGGEPFDQAENCGKLAYCLQRLGKGVMVFTGYTLTQLQQHPKNQLLLDNTDLLKTGPYIEKQKSTRRPWIGSDNQKLHFLTPRYLHHPDLKKNYRQSITIDLTDNIATISGWPDFFE